MKELSIEEKARRYDEAKYIMKEYIESGNAGVIAENTIKKAFPELMESEDERIRKEIIEQINLLKSATLSDLKDKQFNSWIAWLEKQGKNKDILEDAVLDSNEDGLIAETIRYKNEKQGEKKPTDKDGPKFKAGDWIVFNGLTLQVKRVVKGYYITTSLDGITNGYDWGIDNAARLWTIQEAKDGDVLIDKSGSRECPFIFKETKPSDIKTDILNPLAVLGYCGIGGAGFTKGSGWGDTANCIYYPATKEQRGLLFQKMKEKGYMWDFEKKELKKIEKNPAWSEEDDKKAERIIRLLQKGYDENCIKSSIDWLINRSKLLRPQPQWKPSDGQMEALDDAIAICSERDYETECRLDNLRQDLRKLREK
jgi:hypothetical protein